MTIKYSKILAVAGVAVLTAMMVAPTQAEETPVPIAVLSAPTTGTIHVISRVMNDNLGVKTANDFVFNVKHWGSDVVGSPFTAAGNTGVTFTLAPGSYVVSTPIVDGYNGVWFGEGISNGFIDLQAGEVLTIARIFDDVGKADVVVVPEVPATDNGGTLPSTATPWFNALAAGMMLSAVGAIGVRKFALQSK